MMTEIFIENQRVDITADVSSLITFAIDDVREFASRQTAFSKTIVLPGTSRNNQLFGNIFETGISNDYNPLLENVGYNFNASRSAKCIIFQDNLQTFKGTLRLLEIVKDRDLIEYEVAINGELTSLNVALSSALLEDLDFSSYNHFYTTANITASWNNAGGAGYYYPLIDYGTYSTNKKDWDFRTLRPALYVKEYIDKMFAAAQFRYSCDLFDTTRFKKLIVPHNQKRLSKLTGRILTCVDATQRHIIDRTNGINSGYVKFGSIIGGLFTSTGSNLFTYTGAETISPTIAGFVGGIYNMKALFPPSSSNFQVTISMFKNGVLYSTLPPILTSNSGTDESFFNSFSFPITLATGDNFGIFMQLSGGPAGPADVYTQAASLTIDSSSQVLAPIDYNEEIEINAAIPKNIRQVDFLVSIVKLFNLYVYEDKYDERHIRITPFIDFYTVNSSEARDWTYKLNRSAPIRIRPMSELNSKIYEYAFKDDSDYYNDLYKKRYNQGYGSYIFDTEFEFSSQKNKLELIFASTPLVGYVGEEKVYPTIFKKSGDTEETIDSVIRIMQSKKVTGVASWKIKNGVTDLVSLTDYGYAGHFDDPDNPDNDLNFGAVRELFFILATGDLSKTQFNIYWSSYMAEITDKDSKLVIAKFYLTPKDIYELDFSKYIFVDGVLFRLNKIIDYNASAPGDCTVELLKVINTTYTEVIPAPGETNFLLHDDTGYLIDSDGGKIPFL